RSRPRRPRRVGARGVDDRPRRDGRAAVRPDVPARYRRAQARGDGARAAPRCGASGRFQDRRAAVAARAAAPRRRRARRDARSTHRAGARGRARRQGLRRLVCGRPRGRRERGQASGRRRSRAAQARARRGPVGRAGRGRARGRRDWSHGRHPRARREPERRGIVRIWNPAAEAITSIDAEAVLGHSAAEAIPGWQDAVDTLPVAASPDPGHDEVVIPVETSRGERWISISGVRFFGGTVYAFRDLTDVRQLEEIKADFIATASHELRTPLAAVYGAAQTLLRHDFALDEVGRDRFVSLIADESERLGRIVNEILLANQLDSGRLDVEVEPFEAGEVVERVVESTRAYAPPPVRIDVNVADDVPSVGADIDKTRQVLVNLVENAMKYSPDGGRVEVGVEARDG